MPDPIGSVGATAAAATAATATDPTGPNVVNTDTPTVDPDVLNQPDQFDKDMFLELLVAQLKYQNPLEPMDSSEFMGQSAQFTTVEKLQELTSQLSESLANDRLGTATGLIGRDVTYTGADGGTATATVSSVRFDPTGPALILTDGSEVGMADVQQVSARH